MKEDCALVRSLSRHLDDATGGFAITAGSGSPGSLPSMVVVAPASRSLLRTAAVRLGLIHRHFAAAGRATSPTHVPARLRARHHVTTTARPCAIMSGAAAGAAEGTKKAKAAVGQMTATNDVDANFAVCSALAEEAAAQGCAILMLPVGLVKWNVKDDLVS